MVEIVHPWRPKKIQAEIGIFGGSGLYDPSMLKNPIDVKVYTPYGAPSDLITVGELAGRRVAFLPRHGRSHTIPPHKIDYKANIWAFKELGVTRIISPGAVGSLQPDIVRPKDFVICDQVVSRTLRANHTFFDGGIIGHVSPAEPFCPELRKTVAETSRSLGIKTHDRGTYVCIEGPRFSTAAESRLYSKEGMTVVGMTCWPECVLSLEAEMCFVNISMVTDVDIHGDEPVNIKEILSAMEENSKNVKDLIYKVIPKIPKKREACECVHALDSAMI